jgi:hypothetical protein
MGDQDKGELYDEYVRQGDALLRENSKLKSQYPINVPEKVQKTIDGNNLKINELQRKLENLFR